MRPAGRAQATPPRRFSPETYRSPRTPSGQCSGPRPPRPGSAPPSGGGARRRRRLPVSSSHGSGRAGGERARRLPPSSFPSPALGGRGRLLPRLLQQPTSNRLLGPTAQAPATRRPQRSAPGAHECRHPRAARARRPRSAEESRLLFPTFSPLPVTG